MRIKNNILKSRKGSILATVLILFLTLSIITMSILYINTTNIRQAVSQQESLQAYYLAYAGIELGYAAIMSDDGALYDELRNNANKSITDDIKYGESDEDEISITASSSDDKKTIKIVSIGTHKKSNRTSTLTMSFPVDFPHLRKWE